MTTPRYLITGASSDLGRAIAEYLDGDERAELILVSRTGSPPALRRPHTVLHGLDLTLERDLESLRDTVAERFSGPFGIIHSVGDFWTHRPLIRTCFADIVRMIHSHYISLCGVAWALLPLLVDRGGGRLVALSCNSVTYSYPDMAPFTSAKAAIETFVRCVANEYSEYNVVANAVALPTVATEKVVRSKPGDHEHYVTPRDVAEFVVDTVLAAPGILNGNTLKVFRHSPTFFHQSYFDRNPRELEILPGASVPGCGRSTRGGEAPG